MIVTETIALETKPGDIVDLTGRLKSLVADHGLKEGHLVVFAQGSTGAVTTVEYEPGLLKDLKELLEKLVPSNRRYHHDAAWGDGNGHSHLRASLLGPSVVVPVVDGRIQVGTWQQVVFLELDVRPRRRTVLVQLAGEQR